MFVKYVLCIAPRVFNEFSRFEDLVVRKSQYQNDISLCVLKVFQSIILRKSNALNEELYWGLPTPPVIVKCL